MSIHQFYYLKSKPDLSYMINDKGEGKILELTKGSVNLTMPKAKMVAKALVDMLKRFGYQRSSFLK